MSRTHAIVGDYNVICDVCGFKMKRSQTRKRWDGLLVCDADWEPQHPQEFARDLPRRRRRLDLRPEGPDRFVDGGPIELDDDTPVTWEDGSWIMWEGGRIDNGN